MKYRVDDGLLSWFAAASLVEKDTKVEVSAKILNELVLDLQEARAELKKVPVLVSDKPMFKYGNVVLQHSDDGENLFVFNAKTGRYLRTMESTK